MRSHSSDWLSCTPIDSACKAMKPHADTLKDCLDVAADEWAGDTRQLIVGIDTL